jgi:hypothetical protein
MRRHTFIVNPNGPVLPQGSAPGTLRTLTLGERYWELSTPGGDWGGEWTWKPASLLGRTWSLASEHGTHLLLCQVGMFGRRWRAEASTGGWTLAGSWTGRTIVTDDDGTVLLTYEPGFWERGPIVPAGGPELAMKLRWHWIGGFTLEDRDGHALLEFRRGPGFFRPGYRVTLSDAARGRADLLPLLALSYLLLLRRRYRHTH